MRRLINLGRLNSGVVLLTVGALSGCSGSDAGSTGGPRGARA